MRATFVGCLEELYKLCLLRVTLVSEYGILKVSQELAVTYCAALMGRIVGGKGLRFVFMLEVALAPFCSCDYFLVFERFYVMSEAGAKAESIESGGNISIEDEMKPEAMKNEGPLLPDNDLKQKRGRRKAAHTKLTNQLRKAVADHKLGAIRLKKLQVAAWRDE
ncbi:hypothetical protein OUZ56_021429 [Daphnia magna]|uniref:Uncharacterized protein n=1 Tax=Daphnia magna TaxID=35525 RepID=A0ABQ9ZHD0_9CRUS|nr:hypothetical protein OUZ56_021429 [Daphnia magna]